MRGEPAGESWDQETNRPPKHVPYHRDLGPGPRPPQVDEALVAELEELNEERRISTWEHDFLESVTIQVKAGRKLSEKQQAIVDRIKEKVRWA